ncbi:DUF3306 domain-containing protein [Shimia sp.]|uniref:DUF3306 domain-containing protein n=1 Tax=Shimia sp. TaxID=1954381 RepID=UPI00356B443B
MSDFWSRRRAAVEAEAVAEERQRVEGEQAAEEQALAERSDEELLAEADLPDPDTLTSAEEVQAFLKSALPQRLKTRALRRLWGMNPVLANLDGLVDYGEDFTDSATVVENLQTAYQVGKGMLSAFVEETADADAEVEAEAEAPDQASDQAASAEALADDPAAADLTDPQETLRPAPAPAPEAEPEPWLLPDADPVPAPARRMRFEFET